METKSALYDRPDSFETAVPDAELTVRPEPAEHIDRRAVRAWRVAGAAGATITLVIATAVGFLIERLSGAWWLVAIPFIIAIANAVIVVWIIPTVRWRQWRYAVTERDVDLKRGIVVITRTLVPMTRVQHVDTTQGPIMRHYGLATVIIATAAGAQEIPALSLEVAEALRDRIAALAGVAEDV